MRFLAAVGLLLVPTLAHAEFVLQAPPPPPEAPAANLAPMSRSFHRPVPPKAVPVALGFGNDIPLRLAMAQIVPPGVTVRYSPGVDPEQIVDWTGGKAWPDVVRSVMSYAHLHAAVAPALVIITTSGE